MFKNMRVGVRLTLGFAGVLILTAMLAYMGIERLAVAPGIVMLVALGIHYRGDPRINAKPSAPTEPLAEVEPELSSAIEATRHVIRDKALTELVAKIRIMAELTSRLHDKRQILNHIPIGPLSASDNTTPHKHYLSFTFGDEQLAVSTLSICGVVEATQLITESSMPSKLRRAIRLRDALVPVIDLGAQLGGQPIEIGWGTSIIILEVTSRDRLQMIGVVVHAVGKVLEILPEEIDPAAASDSKIRNDFTLGTVTVNNHRVTLLDIGRGLLANEFIVLRSVAQSVAQENIST